MYSWSYFQVSSNIIYPCYIEKLSVILFLARERNCIHQHCVNRQKIILRNDTRNSTSIPNLYVTTVCHILFHPLLILEHEWGCNYLYKGEYLWYNIRVILIIPYGFNVLWVPTWTLKMYLTYISGFLSVALINKISSFVLMAYKWENTLVRLIFVWLFCASKRSCTYFYKTGLP